ncbi:MAG TPA: protein kinase [Terriglobales bacterium]|jgi:serine/threonine protein kinase|nr:protein kinase [Terriglobales bacterium]
MIGQTISHYRVIAKLGAGAMGVVYEAEDVRLKRRVALKFIPDNLAHDPKALQRFEREAHAASSLNHPSICTIYEVEEHDGQPVIVMELLKGESLKERIHKGSLASGELWELGIQTSDALGAAHAQGIIHRDIKPANIFMAGCGRVKILDFGLAKAIPSDRPELGSDEESLTVEGVIPGTTAYMSPEQVRGEEIDARSDLFSLGIVLYEAATGQRPFTGKNRVLLMNAILNEKPAMPSRVNPTLPAAFDTIIGKALEKDRNLRYQNAAEIHADLQLLRRDTDSHASSAVAITTDRLGTGALARPSRANLGRYLAAVILAAALIALGLYYRSHLNKPLTDKDTIVLADFDNGTGDAVFDDTLKTALRVSLRQSPFLNVLSDGEVSKTLQQMTRPVNTKLTPEVARELCQRVDSKAYIAGSVGRLGAEYVLGLKAVNCLSGDTLAEEQVTAASKERVLEALGRAASKLRGELGESLATVQKFDVPLERATTSSLEALKAYSLGGKANNEKGAAAELPYDQRAIELDPNFAMGYLAVGTDYFNLGELGRASEYLTKAFQLREHASERERLAITAQYYSNVTGELDKAAQTYREEIEGYPRESTAYGNLGLVFGAQGQYEKAVEIMRQALRLAPDRMDLHENLANYTLALQRFEETRKIIHDLQAQKGDDSVLHNALYALAFLGADSTAMAEQLQWFASKPDYENWGLALASDAEAYGGQLGKARELTKRAVDSAIRVDSKENGAIFQAIAAQREAAYGNPAEARQAAAEALKLAPTSQGVESEAALAFAMAGDTARANSLAQDLEKRFPLDTQMQSLWLPAVQAQLAVDRRNTILALKTLQATARIELGQIPFVVNISCLYPVYVRGEAYLAAGQGSAAASAFQEILDHSGIVWNCWTGALAHLGVARANVLEWRTLGGADADAARVRALAAYKDFLALWKDADPDIPILKQAKTEYAKLQ